jgi:hypothetical protein
MVVGYYDLIKKNGAEQKIIHHADTGDICQLKTECILYADDGISN